MKNVEHVDREIVCYFSFGGTYDIRKSSVAASSLCEVNVRLLPAVAPRETAREVHAATPSGVSIRVRVAAKRKAAVAVVAERGMVVQQPQAHTKSAAMPRPMTFYAVAILMQADFLFEHGISFAYFRFSFSLV